MTVAPCMFRASELRAVGTMPRPGGIWHLARRCILRHLDTFLLLLLFPTANEIFEHIATSRISWHYRLPANARSKIRRLALIPRDQPWQHHQQEDGRVRQ